MLNPSKITIDFIDHERQRYDTCGDYILYPNGEIVIKVSKTGNADYNCLIALHELIEVFLTQKRGISEESIAKFDIKFEKKRKKGNTDEPGDFGHYKREHRFAENMERLLAHELGVDWNKYSIKVTSL